MAAHQFIFLERNVEEDKKRLSEAVEYYSKVGGFYQVSLFCSIFSAHSVRKLMRAHSQ